MHNPNGRFVVVCGDGEYIIYTALAWRNKSFGTALDFAWSVDSSEFAVRLPRAPSSTLRHLFSPSRNPRLCCRILDCGSH